MAEESVKKRRVRKPAKSAGEGMDPGAAVASPAEKPARASRRDNGKKLVIVESPAKSKTINRYLGDDYIVKASMGHVRDLPEKGLGVDLEHDFAPTYEPLASRWKVLAELKKLAGSASEVFLATDLDREGEAIAWHLAEALNVPPERLRRVTFNEITKTAIQEAFSQPGQINVHKVDAQQARRILDRIVGYQLSPLLWRKVAPGLSAGRVQSVAVRLIVDREREIMAFMPEEFWRIGGVFTTDLGQADAFARQWAEFMATLASDAVTGQQRGPTQAQQIDFLAARKAFKAELVEWAGKPFNANDEQAALEIAKALGLTVEAVERKENPAGKGPSKNVVSVRGQLAARGKLPPLVIESVTSRQSTNRPPGPFTTATMQQAASIQLRFAASRTMRLAQQLYEGVDVPGEGSVGLITYMRTDSLNLSPQAVAAAREFVAAKIGPNYIPEKPNFYRSSDRAQAAHEAVRPTDVARTPESLGGALEGDLLKLYSLIWRRFVSCQMAPAVWDVTEANIAAVTPAGKAVFKASGRKLAFDGYLRVAGMPRHEEQILPELVQASPVAPIEVAPTQHFTQPPARYTEASLVKSMEAEGIGRPSTYAAIIQTIQDRQYVRQEERKFFATDLGMKVTDKLVQHFPDLFDIRFTAKMEDLLDDIEEARADWIKVLHDFYGPFHAALEKAATEMVHAKAESEPSDYTCPNCSKPMTYRWSKNGRYLACSGYPECKTTFPVDSEGKKVERKEVSTPCPLCAKTMLLRRSRFGPFLGCSDYPNCKGTLPCDGEGEPLKLVKEEDIKENCPECGSPMAVRRKGRRPFLGCTRYPDCKGIKPIPEGVRLASPPKEPAQQAGVNCPKCKKPMLIRASRRGPFIACSGFPRCRNAYDISKLEELKAGKVPAKH